MAFSLTKHEIMHRGYVPFIYNSTKVGDEYLVVAENGQWAMLSKEEFGLLEHGVIESGSHLFNVLEEKGIILTLKNEDVLEELYRKRFFFLLQGPSLHIMVLTGRCNHKCVYCHASPKCQDAEGLDMSIEKAKETVDFILKSPSSCIGIEFQGGEPLLNFDVLKFAVEYAKEKNRIIGKDLRFSVVTNLQKMDDEKLDFLFRHDVSVCTSLDGPEELHNHNRIPGDANFNSHRNVVGWIKKIQTRCMEEGKNWEISALMTTTRKSLSMAKEIIDEYVRLGLKYIHIRYMNKMGFYDKNSGSISYSAGEFIAFWKECLEYIFELNKKGVFIEERMASVILSKILGKNDSNFVDLRSPCGACISQLSYGHDGSVFSCDEGRMVGDGIFRLGGVDEEYGRVISSEAARTIITSSIIDNTSCQECVWKPYCGTCPVETFARTNSLIPNIFEDDRCRIQGAQFRYIFGKIKDSGFQEKIIKKWFLPESD